MNKHEKKDQVEIATLELMQALKALTRAHENLMIRNFDLTRDDIAEIIKHAEEAVRYIPEEPVK